MMNNKAVNTHIDVVGNINAINTLIQSVIEKERISFSSVIELLRKERKEEKIITFPASILKNRSLGILEAVTKYLKEEFNLTYHEIATLLNRDDRSIWVSYNKTKNKFPQRFVTDKTSVSIPVSIFTNRKLGLLENLSLYLKENLNLRNKEIAKMLSRDNRTIWTCYNRAKKKENKSG